MEKRFYKTVHAVDYCCSSTNILYTPDYLDIFNVEYTKSGCGNREEHNNIRSMVMQRQHPLLELP